MHSKTIIVTGASGSLGSAVIQKLISKDYNIVLVARKIKKLQELAESLQAERDFLLILAGDVTSDTSVHEIVEKTVEKFQRVDILIQIAGTYKGGKPIYQTDLKVWDDLFNLNAKSLFILTREIVPIMITQGSGLIITVSSKNALEIAPTSGIYAASKNVTLKLSQTLAKELIDKNIRVNCILPSIIDSAPNRESMPKSDFTKWVKPESIADVIEFLLSNEASAITGAAIPVYGKLL